VNKEAEDTLAALHGGVKGTVRVRVQFLHRSEHVSCFESIEGLVGVNPHIFPGINVKSSLVDQHVVLHHVHPFVLIPSVLKALVRLSVTSFISTRLLKCFSFATNCWRRA